MPPSPQPLVGKLPTRASLPFAARLYMMTLLPSDPLVAAKTAPAGESTFCASESVAAKMLLITMRPR